MQPRSVDTVSLTGLIARAKDKSVPVLTISTADEEAMLKGFMSSEWKPSLSVFRPYKGWVHGSPTPPEVAEVNIDGGVGVFSALQKGAGCVLPPGSVVVILNADRLLKNDPSRFVCGLKSLRPKCLQQQVIILVGTDMSVPADLQHDVMPIKHALPTAAEIEARITPVVMNAIEQARKSGRKTVDDDTLGNQLYDASRACVGMPSFAAEQAVTMVLGLGGIDIHRLWGQVATQFEQIGGASLFMGAPTPIAGCQQIQATLHNLLHDRRSRPVNGVLFIDEYEKQAAGERDSNGIGLGLKSKLLQKWQEWSDDSDMPTGMLFMGPAGTAKSASVKGLFHQYGVPVVNLDIGGARRSLVGETEQNFQAALDTTGAMADGRVLVILACNAMTNIDAAIQRRCGLGLWYFDLPTAAERQQIWELYWDSRWELVDGCYPASEGYTGAEIKAACQMARFLGTTPYETVHQVTPVCQTAREEIDRLRTWADGRMLSASKPGLYRKDTHQQSGVMDRSVTL